MQNLTFGDGPRNSVGVRLRKLQSKLAVVLLLRNVRFDLAEEHKNTELKFNTLASVQTPVSGINLIVAYCGQTLKFSRKAASHERENRP